MLVTYGHTLDGTGFTISTEGDFGGCLMIGVPRTLMIVFTQPVDASRVSSEMIE